MELNIEAQPPSLLPRPVPFGLSNFFRALDAFPRQQVYINASEAENVFQLPPEFFRGGANSVPDHLQNCAYFDGAYFDL